MKVPPMLNKYNLVAPKRPPRRLVMTTEGSTGAGKSDFILRTGPRKRVASGAEGILVVNIDRNLEPIEGKYVEDDILIKNVDIHLELNKEKDLATLMEVRNLILDSIVNQCFRTVLIDTGSGLYDLARRGYFGSLEFGDVPQSSYSTLNSFFEKIFTGAKQHNVNLCMTHHIKDSYEEATTRGGKKTAVKSGKQEMHCWSRVMQATQCHVKMSKNPAIDTLDKFSMTVVKCNANPLLEGMEWVGEDITFTNLGKAVYGGSTDEDWE